MEQHSQYRTRWCEFFWRSHGCRWGNQCWFCHTEEDFLDAPMRTHYILPIDLRLKPAEADVPASRWDTSNNEEAEESWWAGEESWSSWGSGWWHNWAGLSQYWSSWGSGWDGGWQDTSTEWQDGQDTSPEWQEALMAMAVQADKVCQAEGADAQLAHATGGAEDQEPSVAKQQAISCADAKLAAVIAHTKYLVTALTSLAALEADPPVTLEADPPGGSLEAGPPPLPRDHPPATSLLSGLVLHPCPPAPPATCSMPPPPPNWAVQIPPPRATPSAPAPAPDRGRSINRDDRGRYRGPAPARTPVKPRIPHLDLTILSHNPQDDPFELKQEDGPFDC